MIPFAKEHPQLLTRFAAIAAVVTVFGAAWPVLFNEGSAAGKLMVRTQEVAAAGDVDFESAMSAHLYGEPVNDTKSKPESESASTAAHVSRLRQLDRGVAVLCLLLAVALPFGYRKWPQAGLALLGAGGVATGECPGNRDQWRQGICGIGGACPRHAVGDVCGTGIIDLAEFTKRSHRKLGVADCMLVDFCHPRLEGIPAQTGISGPAICHGRACRYKSIRTGLSQSSSRNRRHGSGSCYRCNYRSSSINAALDVLLGINHSSQPTHCDGARCLARVRHARAE